MNDFGFDAGRPTPHPIEGMRDNVDNSLEVGSDEYCSALGEQMVARVIRDKNVGDNSLHVVAGNMYADTQKFLNAEDERNMRKGMIVDVPGAIGEQERFMNNLEKRNVMVLPGWVLDDSLPSDVREKGGVIAEALHEAYKGVEADLAAETEDGKTPAEVDSLRFHRSLLKYGAVSKSMAEKLFHRRVGKSALSMLEGGE